MPLRPALRSAVLLGAAATLLLVAGAGGAALTSSDPAAAATTPLCAQFGTTRTADGLYTIANNRWGTTSEQCIDPSATGFQVGTAEGSVPVDGPPKSYPSVYWGCHYGDCTPGFAPVRVDSPDFAALRTSVAMTLPTPRTGTWNAAYDIWFDPTPRRTGQNTGLELMIWLDGSGAAQPIGSKVDTVVISGATYDVWLGQGTANVLSYVRRTHAPGPTATLRTPGPAATRPATPAPVARTGATGLRIDRFYADAVRRGQAQPDWYLTSIQAGFELWSGGTGLSVTGFSVRPTPVSRGA